MKTTFKFIIAAMAAIAVFASCQKELVGEISNNTDEGIRVISVQFDNSTKATLNGLTPSFENEDLIRVSDGIKSEVCTLSVSGSTTTFTTTLSGALTAIYPADAAVLNSDAADAPIAASDNIKVLAFQDGDVANAIIAKADITAKSTSATFNVQTALFQITPPSGVKTFTITSLKPVVDGVARTGTAVAINTEGADDAAKCVINVSNSDSTTFYVALKDGVNLSDLSFEYTTDATHGAMKGIPTKAITAAEKTNATVANTKYTIGETGWHPYVKIQMNSKTYKWATMNIGASSEIEYGHYFMWGYTEGHTATTNSTGAFASQTFKDGERGDDSKGFAWNNYIKFSSTNPQNNKKVFTKYVPLAKVTEYGNEGTFSDDKTTLDLADDAANANWGGSWRMPTKEEFEALKGVAGSAWDGSGTVKGFRFGTSSNQIFLPAAGYGNGTGLDHAVSNDSYGSYWSSSLFLNTPDRAYFLRFYDGYANLLNDARYYGQAVRALSE